jgi:hypothetical protein
MKPAGASVLEGDGGGFLRSEAGGETVPPQPAVNAAARQLGVEAAPHGLEDVVQRQGEAASQLDDQAFFPCRHRGLARVGWMFTLTTTAYNLVRLPKLLPAVA